MQLAIPSVNLAAIAPELVLTAAACVTLLVGVYSGKEGQGKTAWLALLGVIAAMFAAACPGGKAESFSGMYSADAFARFFNMIFLIGAGLAILISVRYAEDEGMNHAEYYTLLLFATVGMMFMAGGSDMMTIFLGLELMSVSVYVLAGYARSREESNEAAMKYFLLGAFASAFLLYGMALIYGTTGQTRLPEIARAVAGGAVNVPMLYVASALILVGLGFKIGAVPFHQWTPDVYQGAPIPVTAFMSAGPKAAGLAALIRIYMEAVPGLHLDWASWVAVLAVLTMTVGNVAALVQTDAKRLLAFSSIAHAGYALVGVAVATPGGASSVMYYMLVYTFMNIGAFGILALVARRKERKTAVSDFTAFAYSNPALAAVMTILVFSLAGIPPMAGFMAKFYVFMAAMKEGHVFLVLAAVLNSAIGVYYYLRFVVVMYMKEKEEAELLPPLKADPALIAALVVALFGVFYLGVVPGKYIELSSKAFFSF